VTYRAFSIGKTVSERPLTAILSAGDDEVEQLGMFARADTSSWTPKWKHIATYGCLVSKSMDSCSTSIEDSAVGAATLMYLYCKSNEVMPRY